jgi:cell division septum initiation protein DivIVA
MSMLLQPATILTRRFSRKVFGVSAREVSFFLGEIATASDRMNEEMNRLIAERNAARAELERARAAVEDLATQVAVLRQDLDRCRAREAMIASALLATQGAADDAGRRSQGHGEPCRAETGMGAAPHALDGAPAEIKTLVRRLAESLWEREQRERAVDAATMLAYVREAVTVDIEFRRRMLNLDRRLAELNLDVGGVL